MPDAEKVQALFSEVAQLNLDETNPSALLKEVAQNCKH